MSTLIVVRHGESNFNRANKFAGWLNSGLSKKGKQEAVKAGMLLKKKKLKIHFYYTSLQARSISTLKLILNTLRIKNVEIIKTHAFNERMYGELQNLSKSRMSKLLGSKKVHALRRSFSTRPKPLNRRSRLHPRNMKIYNKIPRSQIPDTESLRDCFFRCCPYFRKNIFSKLKNKKNIIICSHGNTIRALFKFLFKLNSKEIEQLNIVTGNPIILKFNSKNKIVKVHYLDKKRKADLIAF